jgi:hypothetical protein
MRPVSVGLIRYSLGSGFPSGPNVGAGGAPAQAVNASAAAPRINVERFMISHPSLVVSGLIPCHEEEQTHKAEICRYDIPLNCD